MGTHLYVSKDGVKTITCSECEKETPDFFEKLDVSVRHSDEVIEIVADNVCSKCAVSSVLNALRIRTVAFAYYERIGGS